MIATVAPSGSLDLLLVSLAIGGTLLALGLGVVLARFLMQPAVVEDEAGDRRQEMLEVELARLLKNQEELKGRLSGIGENQVQQSHAINKTLNERLDGVSQRLSDNMTEQTKKTSESLGKLNERLSVIDEAQKNLTGLSTEFLKLQDILNNKQARGAFGEIQLNDLVRNALPPSAYSFQTTLGNGKRADCVVLLPNPPGPIVIDAKFPLDAYHALRNAETDADKVIASRRFGADVLKHVKDISEKYIVPGETAESALMFLPSEAVYAELHSNFTDVVAKSYKARVWIVSPTTLMATLNTVRAVLKDAQMREQAHIIQAEVGKMMEDVERLDTRVGNLRKHFGMAEKDIRDIETSNAKIIRKGEKIKEVELEDVSPALASPSTAPKAAGQPDLLAEN